MGRRASCLVLILAACGGGGGGGVGSGQEAAALNLRVQVLDAPTDTGPVPLLVSIHRGNALESDYTGLVSFESPDPAAWYPTSYRFTEADRGSRSFAAAFVFPVGVHVLTVTGEGIDEPARIAISVQSSASPAPKFVPSAPPAPPDHEFMTRMEPAFAQTAPLDLVLLDADGDGDLDLLGPGYQSTGLWLNNGNGGLAGTSQAFPAATGGASADIDGDGDTDFLLVSVANGAHKPKLWINSGGTFTAGAALEPASNPAFGDVDGDGDEDLLIFEGQTLVVRANDGEGDFGSTLQDLYTGLSKHRPVLGDVDGDGDLDLFANRSLYRNGGSGVFEGTGLSIDRDVRGAVFADMDGDSDLDLVLGNFYQQNDLYVNDGQGGFTKSPALETWEYCTTDIVAIDIDEDGDLDVLECNLSSPDYIWVNEGSTFTGMAMIFPGGEIRFAAGDLNGDGLLDVISSEYWDGRMVWYRND